MYVNIQQVPAYIMMGRYNGGVGKRPVHQEESGCPLCTVLCGTQRDCCPIEPIEDTAGQRERGLFLWFFLLAIQYTHYTLPANTQNPVQEPPKQLHWAERRQYLLQLAHGNIHPPQVLILWPLGVHLTLLLPVVTSILPQSPWVSTAWQWQGSARNLLCQKEISQHHGNVLENMCLLSICDYWWLCLFIGPGIMKKHVMFCTQIR